MADHAGVAAGTAGPSDEEVVLGSLEIGGSGTVRDIHRSTGRRFQKARQVQDILERLAAEGRARRVQGTRAGRGPKATRYELPR